MATLSQGRPATEEDNPRPPSPAYPRASEAAAEVLVKRGVRAATVRLPQVHNTLKQGLVSYAIAMAREKNVSAYVGEGLNRWAAVHVLDAARLYRLALEKLEPGARYHAVAEEGVAMRDIAECIGRGLNVPVVSLSVDATAKHFGWFDRFISYDLTGSSVQTQQRLGWRPTGPGLIADLDRAEYLTAVQTA
nr:Unknown Function [uncultured bacterium]